MHLIPSLLQPRRSPDGGLPARPLQGVGVADQLVQHVDDLSELGPVGAFPLPAVEHELVQRHGAVHGWGQPVALIDGLDHLHKNTWFVCLLVLTVATQIRASHFRLTTLLELPNF